ncbi:MAG: DUF2398 family protein, partial [Streptosporangiaceae bacterium]|nr:DUF2398 family protein [Streptosporangiaceae bacterium]
MTWPRPSASWPPRTARCPGSTAAYGRSWTRWPKTAWSTGSRTRRGPEAWPGTATGSYTLIATTRQVRLSRRLDALDPTQGTMFSRNGRPFDRRRLACLCLVLASFQRSRVEISLADLVRTFTPAANAIDGLGFDPTISAHKAAVVDVLDWLVERGALRLSDGSLEAWARDSERGDALYD